MNTPIQKPSISAAEAKKPAQRARASTPNSHSLRDLDEYEHESFDIQMLRAKIAKNGRIRSMQLDSF